MQTELSMRDFMLARTHTVNAIAICRSSARCRVAGGPATSTANATIDAVPEVAQFGSHVIDTVGGD